MSKNVEFKLALKGLNELMKSPEMQAIEESALAQVAGQLGDGFEVESSHPIGFVAIGSVRAKDNAARLAQNKNSVIDKAFGGVRI
jgi:hypothetical protein